MTSQALDDALSRHGITHCRVLVHDDVVSHGLVIVALCENSKGGNAGMAIPDAVVSATLGLDSVATVGVGPR